MFSGNSRLDGFVSNARDKRQREDERSSLGVGATFDCQQLCKRERRQGADEGVIDYPRGNSWLRYQDDDDMDLPLIQPDTQEVAQRLAASSYEESATSQEGTNSRSSSFASTKKRERSDNLHAKSGITTFNHQEEEDRKLPAQPISALPRAKPSGSEWVSKDGFLVRGLRPLKSGMDRTSDDIHGSICFDPVIKEFIDSRQFQRLRGLKQLGVSEHTYINATHSRFEHSLGVCHLAYKFCAHLRERQPYLNITQKDILCVAIAGLCHDLGHGPFR